MPALVSACYKLRSSSGELLSCVVFGPGPAPASDDLRAPEWRTKAICLLRGACVHFAPKNAASFLISWACKLAAREFGWRIFHAYLRRRSSRTWRRLQSLELALSRRSNRARGRRPARALLVP
jgi:hypothetical protein